MKASRSRAATTQLASFNDLERLRPTSTSVRLDYGKVRRGTRQTPAAGDTTSRLVSQVAGIHWVNRAPLDQESPGSSPGGATQRPKTTSVVLGLRPSRPTATVSATVSPNAPPTRRLINLSGDSITFSIVASSAGWSRMRVSRPSGLALGLSASKATFPTRTQRDAAIEHPPGAQSQPPV